MKLQVIGCSHHGSSVAVRERLAFSPAQARDALAQWRVKFPLAEAVLLSTCNRVEVYTATLDAAGPSHEAVAEFLAECHQLSFYEIFDELFEHTDQDAVRHLFTVAASLDSMVVGEPQILAQVKQAYQLATEQKSTGPLTNEVFQRSLKVARRVASETAIHQRRVSIPSVAVADFASEIFERFDDKRVLVVGAGEMAEETLLYLQDRGAKDITVINRHAERAQHLAVRFHGRIRPWEQLDSALEAADLVVSTTGAPEPIVGLSQYQQIERRRGHRPLFVLDLAIPRDFDPAIGTQCEEVYLYSIDDLSQACQRNRKARDKELPLALDIIEEETAGFMADLRHRITAPIIRRLLETSQSTKDLELERLFNKLGELGEQDRQEISRFADRLVNKLLHPPLESLRDEARNGTPHALLDALKRLFQLKD